MESGVIEVLASAWEGSISFVVILGLAFFSFNRMKRVDELSDARVSDALSQTQNLAEIEKETIKSVNSLRDLIVMQRGGTA